jgi:hypothetical protein
MKRLFLSIILISIIGKLDAQTKWTSTAEAISWLNSKIAKISQNELTITQALSVDSKNNYYCKVNISSINASGKSTSDRYEFYIEHLNPQSFVVNVSGKSLTVKISTQNQSKVIKSYKGESFSSFDNTMEIYFDDIQMAREGIEALKLICDKTPISQINFNTKEQVYSWLKTSIKESKESYSIQNKVEIYPDQSHKIVLTAKETDEKGLAEERKYEFYISDFNPSSFSIKSSGTKLGLSFISTNKLKPIKYFQDGIQKNYTDKFEIYGTDPLNLIQILNAFKYLAGGVSSNESSNLSSEIKTGVSSPQPEIQTQTITQKKTPVIVDLKKLPIPEYALRPYWLTEKYTLSDMERVDAQTDVKVKGMGYGGAEYYYTAFSPISSVVFKISQTPVIIIKTENGVDPSEIVSLVKGEEKSDRRRFIQGSMKMGGKSRDIGDATIELRFEKLVDNIYQIILPSDILPGEYAFMPINSNNSATLTNNKVKLACFRIEY